MLLIATFGVSQTQVPNENFEDWSTNTTANDSLDYWNAAIYVDLGYPLGVVRVATAAQESSDVVQGSFAVKMETRDVYGNTVPGMMQLGRLFVSNDNFSISGGIPFTDRPLGMSFFAKYTPAGTDTAFMFTYLTRYDNTTHTTDTVGGSFYIITDTVASYTQILLPFVYKDTVTPDTMNIIFISTSPFDMKVGSTLWVDSLQLKYSFDAYPTIALAATKVTDTSFTANWFPSAMANEYYLDVATDTNFVHIIPGFDNLLVDTFNYDVTIPSANQNSQNYFYRVRVKYGDTATSVNSNVITVVPLYPTVALPATDISITGFTANWAKQNNAQSYNLDVATDILFTSYVTGYQALSTTDTSKVVSGLDADSTYYYRVQTVYSQGSSPYSNIISLVTITNIPKIKGFNSYFVKNKILHLNMLPKYADVNIYDVNGRNIYSSVSSSESLEIPINISGVYFVTIRNNKEIYKLKISM